MRLLAIILNYKTAAMTVRSLESLVPELREIEGARAVVVDNDSQDGSFEHIRAHVANRGLCDLVEVVASGHNGGFGAGNNFAMRRALASADPPAYVYLLNSDAFPEAGAVRALLDYMEGHPDVGITGSYVHGTDGVPHHTAFQFPSALSELEGSLQLGLVSKLLADHVVALPIPEATRQVDWLAGASMMMRRQMLEEVGLFDETFFLYFEETDLCRRAALHGWPTVYVRESSVTHIGSASTGLGDETRRMPQFWFDSRRHYFLKNHGPRGLWLANAAFLTGHSLFRLKRLLKGDRAPLRPQLLRDFVRHGARGAGLRVT
jgi:GT2 family glycosyltransferase